MTATEERVHVFGRLRGVTRRRLESLAAARGVALTRGTITADVIVLGHNVAGRAVSDAGELRLGFRRKPNASLMSEQTFRSRLGLPSAPGSNGQYSEGQVAIHANLNASQLQTLCLFDVLAPADGRYSYADLAAARTAGRLFSSGAKFPKIIVAALALERRGERLSSVHLAEAPWGAVLQVLEGALAEMDGQLVLPLEGSDLDADGAFALAEESEQEGDLLSARRWYELALRLDATDPVIPFNLGNVLDELGLAQEAEIAYRRAIARSPDMADAWFNLGVLQENVGRDAEALSSYAQAFAADPTYADALHNAALLHMRRREFAAAIEFLERILSIPALNDAEIRRLAQLCRLEARAAKAHE
ncbi:MAG TPA: tetratricopeptide repeat protein [Roseiarcus sp.]|nr:tetratricopeptide repeat protein [Roseiarcus sp.]